MTAIKKIPVLVVGGFLGSGKTSLVRRLLEAAQAEGARVAFVSNEFGELGIDEALLGGGEEEFVEIAGGCVCCQLNDELYDTLISLREKVDPDRIVIEASGVAVPHDIQITFWQEPIRDWISEEAVVVVVNADQLHEGLEVEGLFAEQLESADLVVLNKVDLVSEDALPGLEAAIEDLHPGVPVVHAVHGDVDPRLLLAADVRNGRPTGPAGSHDHAAHAHLHEVYESFEISMPPGLSAEEILARIEAMPSLRVKGFVRSDTGVAVVQGVGRRVEVQPFDGPVSAELVGRVVVIRRIAT